MQILVGLGILLLVGAWIAIGLGPIFYAVNSRNYGADNWLVFGVMWLFVPTSLALAHALGGMVLGIE